MTKVIIFDLGGVIVAEKADYIAGKIAEMIGVSLEDYQKISKELKNRVTSGEITLLEMYAEIVQVLGKNVDPQEILDFHLKIYVETSTEKNPDMLDLIEKLKKNYKVVALTNTEIEIADYNKEHGLFDHFEKAYTSTDLKCRKPNQEIYDKVLSDLGVNVEDVLFIDNDPVYLEGSERAGWPSVLFVGYDKLVEELKERNIEF